MQHIPEPRLILAGDRQNFFLFKKFKSMGIPFDIWGFDYLSIRNNRTLDLNKYKFIIVPIPFSINGKSIHSPFSENDIQIRDFTQKINKDSLVIGGPFNFEDSRFIDITRNREFSLKSLIPTCEEVLKIAIEKTDITILGADILILGTGLLANKLKEYFKFLGGNIIETTSPKIDIVINVTSDLNSLKKHLETSSKYTTFIDISPGEDIIDKRIIKARGLPVKSAPRSMAKFLFETITSKGFLP